MPPAISSSTPRSLSPPARELRPLAPHVPQQPLRDALHAKDHGVQQRRGAEGEGQALVERPESLRASDRKVTLKLLRALL